MLQRFVTVLSWILTLVVAVVAVPLAGAQPATAGGANPAETLLGQAANVCAGGSVFQVEVTGTAWLRTAEGRIASGNAMWAIVFFEITNLSATEAAPYEGDIAALKLVDEQGRESSGNVGPVLADVQRRLAAAGGRLPFTDPVPPGTQDSRVIAFEAPPDAQRLTIASQFPC